MIKKYSLVLVAFLCFVLSGFGQGSETFENIPTNNSSYSNRNWTGDNGVTWTATSARTDQTLTARAICTNGNGTVTSPSYAGGMGTLTFNYVRAFTGTGARSITVWVNGVQRGGAITVSTTSDVVANYNSALNITGPVILELRTSGAQIKIDDVSWTSYAASDPNLAISGTPTNHGSTCPGTAASTIQYTITNSGTLPAVGVTATSNDPQFVVSGLSPTTIAAGGTATYNVTFTPATAGAKSATITVASTTPTSNSPTSSLTGTGTTVVAQAVTSSPATLPTATTATLNGNVTALGICPSTIEKGFVYSETSLNANPLNGGANVTKTVVAGVATGAYNLALAGLIANTQYSFKSYVYNGTTYLYSGVRSFTTQNLVDYCNVQNPGSGTKEAGEPFNIQAQVYEAGLTDTTLGQAPGIEAWIGYRTTDATSIADFATGWTWVSAGFNVDTGNNDEYQADLGSVILIPGTYYYVSRFRIGGASAPFSYGGFSGGFWNGTTNVSGVLTITPAILDYYNLQFPQNGAINTGGTFDVYAQAYETGVTEIAGRGNDVVAWIGYRTTDAATLADFNSGWTWVSAPYFGQAGPGPGNNDEFRLDLGAQISTPGTYYYVSRFQYNSGAYLYGGFDADGVGPNGDGAWDGTEDVSGVLTVTDPPLADVVITEIMYNSVGTDDEWIEICNVSGSVQNLSLYKIKFEGATQFTFPANTFIADGTCITISLGSDGDGTYNDPCPFTPTYGIGASTNYTNNLTNGTGPYTIQLCAANGITIADTVSYGNTNGGNGNDASLHVLDVTLDNSSASTNWQQVLYGGTPNINFLVSSCAPNVPKIDIERNTFATITNGAAANTGNNTLWGGIVNVGNSVNKTYYVRNEGFANLIISSMSSDIADFELVGTPTFPFVMAPGDLLMFEVSFSPITSTPATKNGIITINSNDPTTASRTFRVRGTAGCPLYTGNIFPTSGPIGTEITVTSSQNLTGATATLNGQPLTVLSSSVGELILKIPNTVTSGGALVVLLSGGCTFSNTFVFIDNAISGCQGSVGTPPNEIFISQVTDSGKDSFTYIELYNGTGSTVNINNYSIRIYNNGRSTPVNANYTIDLNNVNLTSGSTYVLGIGASQMSCEPEHDLTNLPDQIYAVSGVSINFSDNNNSDGHDHIRLYNNNTHIDSWGVYQDETWATSLNLGGKGANFMRRTDVTLPSTTYSNTDWIIQDWGDNCADLDYSDIGVYDFSTGVLPSVSVLNAPVLDCEISTTLSVVGTEGLIDSIGLTYQWYYSAPNDLGWTIVPDNALYDDVTTNTLQILNASTLDGFQYYCEVRENDATCFIASNAIKLDVNVSRWNGTSWLPTAPGISTIAIIDANYDTSVALNGETSFSACSLIVNSGASLKVADGSYVEIINDVTVNGNSAIDYGEILVDSKGSFVQRGTATNAGVFLLNGTAKSQVNKFTAKLQSVYDYTYWSSPVANATVDVALSFSNSGRRFWYNAANYLSTGGDDIDDNANDWTRVLGVSDPYNTMVAGRGYASTHSSVGFIADRAYQYFFDGAFNTGDITYPLAYNAINTDHWNLVGNPYPSAIDADQLFLDNSSIKDVIYLWSHFRAPDAANPGNEVLNFNQNDYLIINATMEIGNGSDLNGDGTINGLDKPERAIPSGQSFFVSSLSANPIIFNNDMRISGTNANDDFYRQSEDANANTSNKLWINMTSDNGAYSQTGIGYVAGATSGFDGMSYDAKRNLSYENAAIIYTTIDGVNNMKFAIQGKNISDLSLDEIVPLGFSTNLTTPTTYRISALLTSGEFLSINNVFIKDNLLNITHNLSTSEYVFSSEPGEFNNRFEIVFRDQALSVIDNEIPASGLTIIDLPNGQVKFTVGNNLDIKAIEIIDILGRTLYQLKGDSPVEVYDLNNLSQAPYIAKVTLSNGQVITKRAVKRN